MAVRLALALAGIVATSAFGSTGFAQAPRGWTEELHLENAAFDEPRAPSVIVHAPPGFDARAPLHLVVFVHGWTGCARVLAYAGPTACRDGERPRDGWGLIERFDEARPRALLVVPQLAFMARNGSPGEFFREGRFAAFLAEMLRALAPRIGTDARIGGLSILAHSAGYETALAIVRSGGVADRLRHVVLLDALYRGVGPFGAWVGGHAERRLVSLFTGNGRTARQNAMLASEVRRDLGNDAIAVDPGGSIEPWLARRRVVIARTTTPHGQVPAVHMGEVLRGLGIAIR